MQDKEIQIENLRTKILTLENEKLQLPKQLKTLIDEVERKITFSIEKMHSKLENKEKLITSFEK